MNKKWLRIWVGLVICCLYVPQRVLWVEPQMKSSRGNEQELESKRLQSAESLLELQEELFWCRFSLKMTFTLIHPSALAQPSHFPRGDQDLVSPNHLVKEEASALHPSWSGSTAKILFPNTSKEYLWMDWWKTPGAACLSGRKSDVSHYLSTHFQRNYSKNPFHSHWAFKGRSLVSPCSRSNLWADLHQKNVKIQDNCLQWYLPLFFSRTKQKSPFIIFQALMQSRVPVQTRCPQRGAPHFWVSTLSWPSSGETELWALGPCCVSGKDWNWRCSWAGSPLDEALLSVQEKLHISTLAVTLTWQPECPRWHHCLLG